MMTTDPGRKRTPVRRHLVVVAFNHVTGRRRDQSAPEQDTRGSAAERGRPRLAAICSDRMSLNSTSVRTYRMALSLSRSERSCYIGNCLLRELPPNPTHFGDQMHDVKTNVRRRRKFQRDSAGFFRLLEFRFRRFRFRFLD